MAHLANIDMIILFFFLGMLGSWFKSDLEVPESISKFLSIFLLLSMGLKGGHEVRAAEDLSGFWSILSVGLATCLIIPLYLYFGLRKRLNSANAAALAACFGSVSAVTLIAAQGLLHNAGIDFSGHMVAIMALMEIPAILVALYLYRRTHGATVENASAAATSLFAAKSVVLLLGGFIIGLLMNEPSWKSIAPVVKDAFKGVLAFFLLDLGIAAQRQLSKAKQFKGIAVVVGCLLPLVNGTLAGIFAGFVGIPDGDQTLIAVLVGSGSYIAAPAAIRSAIPEANPSLYVSLPLALTFPMNVIIGIPYYIELSRWF